MKANLTIGIREELKYYSNLYVDREIQTLNLKKELALIVVQQLIRVKIVVKDQDKLVLNSQTRISYLMMF